MAKRFTRDEVTAALRMYRQERLSYRKIGERLGRNHSSIGYLIRREDLAEEEALQAMEEAEDAARRRSA